jgi:nucleoside-diphosphate-sugar epimerase
MVLTRDEGLVIVTGAGGHIGRAVCRLLASAEAQFLAVDLDPDGQQGILACDLRLKDDIARLFQMHAVRTVIHLAGILPSSFQRDPLMGVDVNLTGSFELLRQAVQARVKRFVFASSMSVYGSRPTPRPLKEEDAAAPDEPYGACKRAVELVGDALAQGGAIAFVALRIARVIGPGIKKTSSPWRSQIFEQRADENPIQIPFAPGAELSLVHVHDVARMLVTLAGASQLQSSIYNTPAETWEVKSLKDALEEARSFRIELGMDGVHGGPRCDGSRFAKEFGFQPQGLREVLARRNDD